MATTAVPASGKPVKTWLGHPGGLVVLFLTEMWERFSYYGMRAILTLFLATELTDGGFGMEDVAAASLYSIYVSMVYFIALPGGWIADRILGTRRSVLWGGIIIALGHYSLAFSARSMFYLGLVLIVLGTGLLKPNISAMVGELYDKHPEMHESRRDAGFTLFYLGHQPGRVLRPAADRHLRRQQRLARGVRHRRGRHDHRRGPVRAGSRRLEGVGLKAHKPAADPRTQQDPEDRRIVLAVVVVLLAIDVAAGTFKADHVKNALTILALVVPALYFIMMFRDRTLTHQERSRVSAYVWIFIGAALFWMIYDQAGSLVNLFTDEKVDRQVGSFEIPHGLVPVRQPGAHPAARARVRVDVDQAGPPPARDSGQVLPRPARHRPVVPGDGRGRRAAARGLISPWWIVLVYFIQTCAELLLSPVGLSVTTKLAPLRYASQVMGLWFLATAAGNALNTWVAPLSDKLSDAAYYGSLGVLAMLVGVCFWFGARRIGELMSGVHWRRHR